MIPKRKALSHDDYTIGWISALPLEMAAAKAMLDEFHPKLPQDPNDSNIYTLGSAFGHNVVIACLPSGVYAIRFGLMVGIGGGAPRKEVDIRLGDIVVSKPTDTFGGVIQYDYGKTIQGGSFLRTGSLNKPPQVLLAAVSEIQTEHMSGRCQIQTNLARLVKMSPKMSQFTHRGQLYDHLYEAGYDHDGSGSTCDQCSKDRLVLRVPRASSDPVIHYGLIASGNQVMKEGVTRDRLSRELGIFCFEMEAAGLMDHFPCLVIRGICDYSDTHKNKQWQEYAAATAAAYARELLYVIPPLQVFRTPTVSDILRHPEALLSPSLCFWK
ncbi:purine and uridine phosphorylase [Aspergillus sclerotioniger CBS 115572]|uniref:Purine and uridine phosphorylase n=1 Tax=Aspergillus sclerotioniger CBS 115572 TaxID=1450535 RepID=A0A317V4D6_9EURO|nr:purine and uridine phosphorylase [Aspergillus sclerotioniger CBS 115572]PWY68509.1 purine and uridine phosphorylase [Aspergillus sclerotioniger CBS 115572]